MGEQIRHSDLGWLPTIAQQEEINVRILGIAVHRAPAGKKTPAQALNDAAAMAMEVVKRGGGLQA